MQIIPSLVENTGKDLFAVITKLSPFFNRFQVDIEDGFFIQNTTLSVNDFAQYISQNTRSLPPNTFYDFHLMVNDYEESMKSIKTLKKKVLIDTVLIHTSQQPDYSYLSQKYPEFKIGLVINPDEEIDTITQHFNLNSVPIIQLMTVYPGKQGQSFIKKVLEKIEHLRNGGFRGKIYLDGGINDKSLPLIKQLSYRPDALCPGSYLAKTQDLESHIKEVTAL